MRRGFREVREIKEVKEDQDRKRNEEGFRTIKPETNITFEEAQEFWDEFFEQLGMDK